MRSTNNFLATQRSHFLSILQFLQLGFTFAIGSILSSFERTVTENITLKPYWIIQYILESDLQLDGGY